MKEKTERVNSWTDCNEARHAKEFFAYTKYFFSSLRNLTDFAKHTTNYHYCKHIKTAFSNVKRFWCILLSSLYYQWHDF